MPFASASLDPAGASRAQVTPGFTRTPARDADAFLPRVGLARRNARRVEAVTLPFRTVSICCNAWSFSAAVFETMQSDGANNLNSRM